MHRIFAFFVREPIEKIIRFFEVFGDIVLFTQTAVFSAFSPPFKRSITRRQMDVIGVGSLNIVVLTGLFMGLVLALQAIVELRSLGATAYLGRPIGTTVIRELGPVLASIMVAARAGSAIAAELASMVIAEQIDALRAEGSDPVKKLVEPRLMACTLMTPVLTAICCLVAFIGGWIVACQIVQITSSFYWDSVMEVLTPAFVWGGLLKALCFGFIIGVVSCYCGIKTEFGSEGVGLATTRTVVISSISILAVDFILTKIYIVTWW
ncbi:MAG: ABC transporter permease [Candidatus Omnitrophica bacterium]|nr:ABC transporter permease [Candidatus Omnitrophota bacterium]